MAAGPLPRLNSITELSTPSFHQTCLFFVQLAPLHTPALFHLLIDEGEVKLFDFVEFGGPETHNQSPAAMKNEWAKGQQTIHEINTSLHFILMLLH